MSGIRVFAHTGDALREEASLLGRAARCESDAELTLWTGGRSLVAPASIRRLPEFETAARRSAARGWPVELRPSGGGIVPQGPGILNLTMIGLARADRARDPVAFYRMLTDPISRVVASCGDISVGPVEGSFCDGKYNIVVNGRKLAGTAQRWTLRRDASGDYAVLAHAVILCCAPIGDACEAIEEFRADLGEPPLVRTSAHVNFQDLVPAKGNATARFAASLRRQLQEAEVSSRSEVYSAGSEISLASSAETEAVR